MSAWQWRQSREVVEIETGTARIAEGGSGRIKTSRRLDWGDYELFLTEANSGAEGSIAFWSGWGGQPQAGVEAPDRVRVQVPDKLPAVGSNVEVTILPPYAGEAEIVVASENVITTRTLSVKGETATKVSLPVTKDWGAGVYVMAALSPRDAQAATAVGVAHVTVDVKPRTFDVGSLRRRSSARARK